MSYKSQIIKGLSWMGLLRLITKLSGFIKMLIIARLLNPEQFGAFGIALLVVGLLEVMTETGVNVILIQSKEINKHINSAWIISILRGIFISFVILIFSIPISSFFNSPLAKNLLLLISIVPLIKGFINPSVIKYQKELKFEKEFFIRFIITFADTLSAIVLTLILKSAIGIAFGLVIGAMVEVLISFLIFNPKPSFKFENEYLATLFHRGKWVTAGGIFNYLFHNSDNIVVGKQLGSASLGIYQVAYSISILPITEISDVFSKVIFPVLTQIKNDKKRLSKIFLLTVMVITFLTILYGAILIGYPKEIVNFILGPRWSEAAHILPILAVFSVIKAITGSSSALFLAVEKQEYVSYITLISFLGLIISIIPLILVYGLIGAAISALVGSILAILPTIYYVIKILK